MSNKTTLSLPPKGAQAVFKFQLPIRPDTREVYLERGARVVHVAVQGTMLAVWYLCVPGTEREPDKFHVRFTGDAAPEGAKYQGTAVLEDGAYILHLFRG